MAPLKAKNHDILLSIEPRLVGAETAAKMCGVSTKYFWQLDRTGRVPLPIQGFGGRRKLWSVDELTKWIRVGCPIREKWKKLKIKLHTV